MEKDTPKQYIKKKKIGETIMKQSKIQRRQIRHFKIINKSIQ